MGCHPDHTGEHLRLGDRREFSHNFLGTCLPCIPCIDVLAITYSRGDQQRMRYIRQKYIEAYGSAQLSGDPAMCQPANSRLRMVEDGSRPANGFSDWNRFEASLEVASFTRPEQQNGRYTASHALPLISTIVEYQRQRQARMVVPGVHGPGLPNDHINLFLSELKEWAQTEITRSEIQIDEIARRLNFLNKIMMDRFHW